MEAADEKLCILKFGSSVLRREEDLPAAALEIYRHVRAGEKVVVLVSALAGRTDQLFEQAMRVGGDAPGALAARLARVGELHAAALMALALHRIGLSARSLDPGEIGLVAKGDPLDSDLTGLDADSVRAALAAYDVVVIPGFTAGHEEHGVATLGRGGTDLSAVFFAARLGAGRARLIKDVAGVHDEDPAVNPEAELYSQLGYAEAAGASAGLIQPKAIEAAETAGVLIEIAALGAAAATLIADLPARKGRPARPERLRVALLGCGAVGGGLLSYVRSRPDLFDLNPVLVRQPGRRHEGLFTDSLAEAMAGSPDLVLEAIGGADFAAGVMRSALRAGAQVVTANKSAVAAHYDSLRAAADAGGGALLFSAAVGGGAPVLETLARMEKSVASVEGVMNGTCNYLLSRLGEGWSFEEALAKAQALGFAEADPAADVDGRDAAEKLSILARAAFGARLAPEAIARDSVRYVTPKMARAAIERGEVLKQVASCRLVDGRVEAEVRLVALPAAHPLARARDEENVFLVRDSSAMVHEIKGKGAGRWPTATAMFADVMDAQRALCGRAAADEPLRLRA